MSKFCVRCVDIDISGMNPGSCIYMGTQTVKLMTAMHVLRVKAKGCMGNRACMKEGVGYLAKG